MAYVEIVCVCCGSLSSLLFKVEALCCCYTGEAGESVLKVLSSMQEEEKVEMSNCTDAGGLMCSLRIRREHQQSRSPRFSHHSPIRNSFKCPSASPKMTTANR